MLNFTANWVRLNEFPEWFTVDENRLYRLTPVSTPDDARLRLGSELIAGVELGPGSRVIQPESPPPYARQGDR